MPQLEHQPTTILDALRSHVATQGDAIAYRFLHAGKGHLSITYRELDHCARKIALALLDRAAPGDRALMMYPAGLDFIEAFLGCLYAGIVPVPAYPPKKNRNFQRIAAIAKDCSPRLLLCTLETQPHVEGQFSESVNGAAIVATDATAFPNASSLPSLRTDQLALLQYTSGSTAAPKGVMVTHANMVANELLIQEFFEFSRASVMVSWLPMFHDMGLIGGILAPLFVGFPSILMSPNTFLREPINWLRTITEHRGTCTGAPNFAYDLCVKKISASQKSHLDLSSLRIAYNGAEPVRATTLERFSKAFGNCGFSRDAFFPCYGMAETTLLISGGPPLIPKDVVTVSSSELARNRIVDDDDGPRLVSCGQCGRDLEVRIVNPETLQECDLDEVGEIWVHGNSVAQGYWQRTEETEEVFRAKLKGNDRDWLRTGDYGFLRNGQLFVTGRLKDLIIVHGRNIYPQDIEQLVEQHLDFVEQNSCVAFSVEDSRGEKLVVVAEGTRDMVRGKKPNAAANGELVQLNRAFDALRASILENFDLSLDALVFVRPASFPKTSSGKVQRRLVKQMLLGKDLEVVWHADVSTTKNVKPHPCHSDEVVGLICQTLQEWARDDGQLLPSIDAETTFTSLGIDSVAAADVGLRLENRLGVRVDGDALYHQRSIKELAAHLARRVPPRPLAGQAENAPLSKADLIRAFDDGLKRVRSFRCSGHNYFETEIERQEGSHVWIGGRKMLMMASYSYLGLNNRLEVNLAAQEHMASYGTGPNGARLLAGTLSAHRQLEGEIAKFFGSDDAMVYSSGFMTNLATVSALVGKGDVVIGDELNHASIVDGCKFSDATFLTFAHNDTGDLEELLSQHSGTKMLVVVEAVYSMDGDIAPLPLISELCMRYGALLMVDEAHSLGVIGKTGKGIQEHFALSTDSIDIKMGTLSKAMASNGGFIAGRQAIIDFLKYNARGFIFSAALPAAQVGAARKCFEIIQQETHLVDRLSRLRARFVAGLQDLGFDVPPTESAIVPIIFSTEKETLGAVGFCRQHGLFVVPVFYPAVPMNKPRIRATVMASFDESDIDEALRVFAELAKCHKRR